MKSYRILLVLLMAMLCLLVFSATAGAVMPETLYFKTANPIFGPPCDEPPDLGFVPLDSYSETLDLISLDGQQIGSGSLCHFIESIEATEDKMTQINRTIGVFSFSEGTLNFIGDVRYKGLPNGTWRVKLRGDIVGGSEAYEEAQGKVQAGGNVTFDGEVPIPDVLFVLRIK
jgi:hypothetical protein